MDPLTACNYYTGERLIDPFGYFLMARILYKIIQSSSHKVSSGSDDGRTGMEGTFPPLHKHDITLSSNKINLNLAGLRVYVCEYSKIVSCTVDGSITAVAIILSEAMNY